MSSWLVYSEDGQHLGPVPSEYVARAVRSGAIQPSRWITEADRLAWRPLVDIPEIRALLEAMTTAANRDRETTIIAQANAFPAFPMPSAPLTEKETPSSGPQSSGPTSERTLIAPAAFEQEMAAIAEPGRAAAGGRATVRDIEPTLATPRPRPGGVNPTLRSTDDPPRLTPRGGAAVLEPDTATVPLAAWAKGPRPVPGPVDSAAVPSTTPDPKLGPVGDDGTQRSAIEGEYPSLTPRPATTPGPASPPVVSESRKIQTVPPGGSLRANRASSSGSAKTAGASGGSVLAFFLGGLALGAVVVIVLLVLAFRGGILR
jgi:hypothetical protein